jgi:hypothetical protein
MFLKGGLILSLISALLNNIYGFGYTSITGYYQLIHHALGAGGRRFEHVLRNHQKVV